MIVAVRTVLAHRRIKAKVRWPVQLGVMIIAHSAGCKPRKSCGHCVNRNLDCPENKACSFAHGLGVASGHPGCDAPLGSRNRQDLGARPICRFSGKALWVGSCAPAQYAGGLGGVHRAYQSIAGQKFKFRHYRILYPAEKCRRIARRVSFTTCSAGFLATEDLRRIFFPSSLRGRVEWSPASHFPTTESWGWDTIGRD